jgi:hypothetical protein
MKIDWQKKQPCLKFKTQNSLKHNFFCHVVKQLALLSQTFLRRNACEAKTLTGGGGACNQSKLMRLLICFLWSNWKVHVDPPVVARSTLIFWRTTANPPQSRTQYAYNTKAFLFLYSIAHLCVALELSNIHKSGVCGAAIVFVPLFILSDFATKTSMSIQQQFRERRECVHTNCSTVHSERHCVLCFLGADRHRAA